MTNRSPYDERQALKVLAAIIMRDAVGVAPDQWHGSLRDAGAAAAAGHAAAAEPQRVARHRRASAAAFVGERLQAAALADPASARGRRGHGAKRQ